MFFIAVYFARVKTTSFLEVHGRLLVITPSSCYNPHPEMYCIRTYANFMSHCLSTEKRVMKMFLYPRLEFVKISTYM